MRRSLRAIAGATVLAALFAMAGPGPAVAQDRREEIAELLDKRARAVMERDAASFIATMDGARSGFRNRQLASFRRMRAVDFEEYRLEPRWDSYGELTRREDRKRYGFAQDVVILAVEERYRIRGFDPQPAVEELFLTFALLPQGWGIVSDSDLEELGLLSVRHAWDFGEIDVATSDRFQFIRHPCGAVDGACPRLSPDLRALASTAIDRLESYWPVEWSRKVIVIVPATEAELGRMIQATFDLDDFVAFAYSTIDQDDGGSFVGNRIVLNPDALAGRSNDSVLMILTHELLHIATRDSASLATPIWVEEGFADYVGHDADRGALSFLAGEVAAGNFDGRLPADHEFLTGDGTSIFRSYQEAHSAVRFFFERWGRERFIRFYRMLGRMRAVTGTSRYHVDRALRRTIGMGSDRFERAWARAIAE